MCYCCLKKGKRNSPTCLESNCTVSKFLRSKDGTSLNIVVQANESFRQRARTRFGCIWYSFHSCKHHSGQQTKSYLKFSKTTTTTNEHEVKLTSLFRSPCSQLFLIKANDMDRNHSFVRCEIRQEIHSKRQHLVIDTI